MHLKHQPEMMMMVENEILLADRIDMKKMKEMSKKNPAMAHLHLIVFCYRPEKKLNLFGNLAIP